MVGPACIEASPPLETDDDPTEKDIGPPAPVDNEISPPMPYPYSERDPVSKVIEPLETSPLGVLIVTSPDDEASLIPEESSMEPPSSLRPWPAITLTEPPYELPAPDDKVVSPPGPV
jgi:hypothetical protein